MPTRQRIPILMLAALMRVHTATDQMHIATRISITASMAAVTTDIPTGAVDSMGIEVMADMATEEVMAIAVVTALAEDMVIAAATAFGVVDTVAVMDTAEAAAMAVEAAVSVAVVVVAAGAVAGAANLSR